MKNAKRRLTRGDLQILQMLWREERVTIAGAHQALGALIGYSTVQTRLNRLVIKGLVRKTKDTKRGRTGRPAVVWKFPARGEFCLVPEHQRTA